MSALMRGVFVKAAARAMDGPSRVVQSSFSGPSIRGSVPPAEAPAEAEAEAEKDELLHLTRYGRP